MDFEPRANAPALERHRATAPGTDQENGKPSAPQAPPSTLGDAGRRLGMVGILFPVKGDCRERLTELLREFQSIILYKSGVPCRRRGMSMFCVVIDATTNELGAFTGKLGMVGDVKVKSFLL